MESIYQKYIDVWRKYESVTKANASKTKLDNCSERLKVFYSY